MNFHNLFLLLFLAFSIVSCSKDDDGGEDTTGSSLVGTWVSEFTSDREFDYDENAWSQPHVENHTTENDKITVVYKSDGTGTSRHYDKTMAKWIDESFDYTVKGGVVKHKSKPSGEEIELTFSISADKLTRTQVVENAASTFKFEFTTVFKKK